MKTFTPRQVVVMVVAVCAAVALAPAGAIAAATLMTISDPSNGSRARVDAGRLRVGDGTGALTVDGTTGPAVPAKPFAVTAQIRATGPTGVLLASRKGASRLAVTAITNHLDVNSFQVAHYTSYVVDVTGFACPGKPDALAPADLELDVPLAVVKATTSTAYPTPLVFFRTATAGSTSCLYVSSTQVGAADFDVSTTISGFWAP
ncbi:hypothetical protein [Nocardioides marmoribigeumensis]|uniref:Secreted protein n=1 Tax=Nocardioides marmoribigeumensis TaxID=433649 RepID=A0ABU2BTJ8_9ACTN|nr:hypothetical protein [Nocardioides marmoribigeumensis]MDR7361349.1 hypothetical protein [Nocardioides marmoribigeumensis]